MSSFKNIANHKNTLKNNILGGFINLEKAKSGIYKNTDENRKLGRVGSKYGEEKGDEKISDTILKKIVKETEQEAEEMVQKDWSQFTPAIINNGFCDIYAEKFIENVGGESFSTHISDGIAPFGHTIIKYNNKFYDAEHLQGVSSITELEYFKRAKNKNSSLTKKEILESLQS